MTPEQKIKHAILLLANSWHNIILTNGAAITADNIDKVYENHNQYGALQDARNEIRSSGTKTGLPCEWHNNYESEAVARMMPDGSWVGWTYWYGGGKHGEPEAIDWMDDAYDLDCKEEQVTVTQRTFTKT